MCLHASLNKIFDIFTELRLAKNKIIGVIYDIIPVTYRAVRRHKLYTGDAFIAVLESNKELICQIAMASPIKLSKPRHCPNVKKIITLPLPCRKIAISEIILNA